MPPEQQAAIVSTGSDLPLSHPDAHSPVCPKPGARTLWIPVARYTLP